MQNPLGMLAAQYAATRTPKGLKRLILANTPASIELLTKSTDMLLSRLGNDFVHTIGKHEADGTTNSKEYQAATMQFYKKHVCRLDPWPKDLVDTFGVVYKNPTVYHTMYFFSFIISQSQV